MEIRTKRTVEIWGCIGLLLAVGLLFAWCSSSSEVNVPKANKQANISANANANSARLETEANNIAVQSKTAEANTNSARKEFNKAATKARRPLKVKKYEETRNNPIAVSGRDLDARERNVLTELRKLYWQQPK